MHTLSRNDPRYPSRLAQIAQPPTVLYARGNVSLLQDNVPCVAIVGSRKMSAYGRDVTQQLARDLAHRGVTIVSGLAYGVDAQAHRAALDAGGTTIAVLPSGLDTIYPAAHEALAQSILESGGLLVSEYPAGTSARDFQFIARNRLIAGLSQAVLITEAAAKSGSLHTAQFALEQGSEVMAVPGSIYNPLSEGTNQLIRGGATPICQVGEIFEALGIEPTVRPPVTPKLLTEGQQVVLDLLEHGVGDPPELLSRSGLPPSQFQQELTLLEIAGLIRTDAGGRWRATV